MSHGPLLSTEELSIRLGDPDLVVLDCSVNLRQDADSGFVAEPMSAAWEQGHIPGSRYCDLTNDLSDPNSDLRFTMPDAEHFGAAMEAMGVGDDSTVVLYDRRFTMWATRVWWMLRAFGFDNAFVLDGGWRSWSSEGRETATGPTGPARRASFSSAPRPELIATVDHVLAAVDDQGTCIINALSPENHDGSDAVYGPAGHIPGASNVYAVALVDGETHKYRPLAELQAEFAGAGVAAADQPIITYCGGGIAATSDAFVLSMLGYKNVAVYDGSMSEWVLDPARPLEV